MKAANNQLLLSLGICIASVAPALAETIAVELRDGRQIVGERMDRPPTDWLWIRSSIAGIELQSGYHRSQIVAIAPAIARARRSHLPVQSPRTSAPVELPAVKVRTLLVEAELAQWDDDVQADGIRVFIAPLAADGSLAPVNGELEMRLLGEREVSGGGQIGSLTPKFYELERGNRLVRREHFAAGPAVLELAFDQVQPEFDPDIACSAILFARLGVFGQGVFEASDAQLALRQPSRIRDELQQRTPSRFFPVERASPTNR